MNSPGDIASSSKAPVRYCDLSFSDDALDQWMLGNILTYWRISVAHKGNRATSATKRFLLGTNLVQLSLLRWKVADRQSFARIGPVADGGDEPPRLKQGGRSASLVGGCKWKKHDSHGVPLP